MNFSIQTGGITGNALVLNSGRFSNNNRGPRLAINTPSIPYDYTVTASIWVKQGAEGHILRYNDSTSSSSGTDIAGLSATEWKEFKVSITNNNDTYMRTIYFDGTPIAQDYSNTFPVLWGTDTEGANQSIYFDNLSITTTDASGETPDIPDVTLPDPAAYYTFDETLEDSVSGESATLTGSKVSEELVPDIAASFVDRDDGTNAISFTGTGSYGLALPSAPTSSGFTVSFDAMAREATESTPFVFMANYDGETLKVDDDNSQWASIMVMGHWQSGIGDAPTIWSRNVESDAADKWPWFASAGNNSLSLDTWHKITLVVSGETGTVYVDGNQIASGSFVYTPDATARMFVGVNDWNTPLNGAIDNLRIYNEALTSDQVKLIGAETAE